MMLALMHCEILILFTVMQVSIKVNPFNYLGKTFSDFSVIFCGIFVILYMSFFLYIEQLCFFVQPFHQLNMCVCVYLWWPSR